MNASQQQKYRGHWGEGITPIHRTAACVHCRFTTRIARRGHRGGALAAVAKLRGVMMAHLRERHPEVLDDTGVDDGSKTT